MKKYKKTLTVIIILIVAIMMFAAFFGVYKKGENGEKIGILPNLKLGMEFGQTRVITATVNQETTKTIYDSEGNIETPKEREEYTEEAGYKTVETEINPENVKTIENYRKTEKIIENKLNKNGISQYFINIDESTGTIEIEIPEDDKADEIQSIIQAKGNFILLDGETFELVFDNIYFEKAEVISRQGDLEAGIFLQLSFNEEGTKRIQELNKIYIEKTEEKTNEDGKIETVDNSKTVWVVLNGSLLGTTVLPNIVYNDKIILPFGISSNSKELEEAKESAEQAAILLNSGISPVIYNYSNTTKNTNISNQDLLLFGISIGIVFFIAYIYLVIKFKAKGFIAVYFQIGFLGTLLLILRIIGITITMEGIAGIIVAMVLEYIFTYIVLRNLDKQIEGMYKKANLEFFLNTLPVYAISIIFTFATRANINSFGMSLFWGIVVIYAYNFIFTKFIFENLSRGSK